MSGFSTSNLDHLDSLVHHAQRKAGQDAEKRAFIDYLSERIRERLASGRSMDSDEYRCLLGLAGPTTVKEGRLIIELTD